MPEHEITQQGTHAVELKPPFFCPASEADYHCREPFEIEVTEASNNICCGSPWVIGRNGFVGFTRFQPGAIRHLGEGRFEFDITAGQELFVSETTQPEAALHQYNHSIIESWPESDRAYGEPNLLVKHEYCTWVEQRLCRTIAPEPDVLTEQFANRYLDRILQLELPPGKFTLDHGWFPKTGQGAIGDWDFDAQAFPTPEKFIQRLQKEGFTPGIWLAPLLVQPGTRLHSASGSLSGDKLRWGGLDACGTEVFDTLAVNETTESHYRNVITRLCGMGFRKFKLDIFYAPKSQCLPVLEMISNIIREVDPGAEIEAHTPDIHLSRYANVIRANDVWLRTAADFELACDHVRTCRMSAPHRITNLDHLTGNAPRTLQDLALAHIGLCAGLDGYPVVSALPDRFGPYGLDLIRKVLATHESKSISLLEKAAALRP